MAVETAIQTDQKPEPLRNSAKKIRNRYTALQLKLLWRVIKQRKLTFCKIFNVFLCNVAYFFKYTKGSPSPYILSLELWNECNAGCLFCRDKKGKIHDINPQGKGEPIPKGKMPAEMAMNFIKQLKDDVLIAVLYTNGEPLLYQDLARVIQYATDNNVATLIASNGLMFTEENTRAILEAGLDMIKIQVSGDTQDIYSIQIRYGRIDDWKKNITMLAKMNQEGGYNTVIMIDYILYDYNKHQLPLLKKFCDDLGLMMSIRPGNPFGGLEELEPELNNETLPLKMSCDYLWKVMQVNWNGDILPCCEAVVWSESKPYDTYDEGKADVKGTWRGIEAIKMRNSMNTKGRGGMAICAQCTRKGVCFKW